jgi:hypothetical protein
MRVEKEAEARQEGSKEVERLRSEEVRINAKRGDLTQRAQSEERTGRGEEEPKMAG